MIIDKTDKKGAFKLIYDGNSGITERTISILSPLDTEEDQYIEAYCFLREGKKTFNTSNIISLTNLETGDVLERKDFKFQFKPVVWMTKKTVSKSGNVYYYEKVGVFSKNYKPSWEKIGQQRFDYYVTNHSHKAVKIERDSSNEICYIEWHEKQTSRADRKISNAEKKKTKEENGLSQQSESFKKNTGCLSLLTIGLILIVIIMSATSI